MSGNSFQTERETGIHARVAGTAHRSASHENLSWSELPDEPYLLLTPGPLTTSKSVKAAMFRDWCTWDDEYHAIVQSIRSRLVKLAAPSRTDAYTAVLMQGSGTFSVEAVIGTALPRTGGKLAVLSNGAYGKRIAQASGILGIDTVLLSFEETESVDPARLEALLAADPDITHVMAVHCETTTGMLNSVRELCAVAKRFGKTTIIDAMSSFGGVPMDMDAWGIDYLVSSSNKCIQGVPGFGFVLAKIEQLAQCEGHSRSLSLDLYDQWSVMEQHGGKWRFTSPTHVVRAFDQALTELEAEGGIEARHRRYAESQRVLAEGMAKAGYQALLPADQQSPIITSFLYPDVPGFSFNELYRRLKEVGFVIYPGKISTADTFRVGNIGDVTPEDMRRLTEAAAQIEWR